MILRRRYLYWLGKAYLKKWKRTIAVSFFIGLAIFFILRYTALFYIPKVPLGKDEFIGLTGSYTLNDLPYFIMKDISFGLTRVQSDGSIVPAASVNWKIEENGKKYTFLLKNGLYFSDGTPFTAQTVSYSFSQVIIKKPDKKTLVFLLKDAYAPFLITVSKPIFKKATIGLGQFRISDVKLNGSYVQSLVLVSNTNQYYKKHFFFYPTDESLKMAFILGEVSYVYQAGNDQFHGKSLNSFPGVSVKKYTDTERLVTLFYNTKDSLLSDEKIRSALTYALQDNFKDGKRNASPISSFSWAYSGGRFEKKQDLQHSLDLITTAETGKTGKTKLIIKTLPKYEGLAKEIMEVWKKIKIDATIEITDSSPENFQIFLGDFRIPNDPDQYTLWHSNQPNNITNYKNLRVDKILEDGRKTIDVGNRKEIYADFQKYLLDDSPAAFLYLPYVYDITRS